MKKQNKGVNEMSVQKKNRMMNESIDKCLNK